MLDDLRQQIKELNSKSTKLEEKLEVKCSQFMEAKVRLEERDKQVLDFKG